MGGGTYHRPARCRGPARRCRRCRCRCRRSRSRSRGPARRSRGPARRSRGPARRYRRGRGRRRRCCCCRYVVGGGGGGGGVVVVVWWCVVGAVVDQMERGSCAGLFWVTRPGPSDRGYFISYYGWLSVAQWLSGLAPRYNFRGNPDGRGFNSGLCTYFF